MGFFDFFKKKKKLNNKTIITIKKPSSDSTQTLDKTAIMYDGIETDGELLEKVYAKNIVDGLFVAAISPEQFEL